MRRERPAAAFFMTQGAVYLGALRVHPPGARKKPLRRLQAPQRSGVRRSA